MIRSLRKLMFFGGGIVESVFHWPIRYVYEIRGSVVSLSLIFAHPQG